MGENCFSLLIYISTLLFNYTQKKKKHLSGPQPNKSLIGERCDRLGKTFLTSLFNNLWAAGGFRVNSSSGEGGLISFPLLLLEGNAILPMTLKADCALYLWLFFKQFLNFLTKSANDYEEEQSQDYSRRTTCSFTNFYSNINVRFFMDKNL